ncbi:MAG: uracil-DNA glycosylase family protein [Flavobacteriales bacterium]|nr:uracil-DNA glycosylase family protein [Flavobacteriales bacterium]
MEKWRNLKKEIAGCTVCVASLVLGPRPVVAFDKDASFMIIGQAPRTRIHTSGIAWNDPGGDRLRKWLNVDRDTSYDDSKFAIMPMGFCYPGKGSCGDLLPRKEYAPFWHERIWE